MDYNFGLAGKTTTDRIGIEVKVTGEVLDYDREYKVKVNPASTVQEGVHFNIPAQNCKLRANRVTDTLWVEVMNTEELKAEKLYLHMHWIVMELRQQSARWHLVTAWVPKSSTM